jgi:multidrug efflux system outer membrane protein
LASAERYPSLDLNAQRSAARTPGDLTTTGRPAESRRYDLNLGTAAFELDFWNRLASLDDAARANYLASEESARAFRSGLIADVANAWLRRIELTERHQLASATLQNRDQIRRLVAKRRDVGYANDLDLQQAEGAYQNARAELAALTQQRVLADNALRLLVGTDSAPNAAVEAKLERVRIEEPSAGLGSDVLLARPDVLAAEQRLIAANANIGAARAAFFPRIVLTASAGLASQSLGGLFDAGSGAWTFAPALRLPLFDFGRVSDNLDLAKLRKNIAVSEYEKAIQQAFREVADLLETRGSIADQLAALNANVAAQLERSRLVEARYRAGVANHLELLDAQRETSTAQQSALATRRQQLTTSVSLYKALGRF